MEAARGGALQARMLTRAPLVVLFIYLMSVYGLSNAIAVLKAGKVIREPLRWLCGLAGPGIWVYPWRFLSALVECPACLSFWIGMAMSILVVSPLLSVQPGANRWAAMVVDGLMACGFSWFVHVTTTRMGHGIEEL